MDAGRFQDVKDALQRLLDNHVSTLTAVSAVLRLDGLPQDWVDDIVSLDSGQKQELRNMLNGVLYAWAIALRLLLL